MHLFNEGDWVAIGTTEGQCPVGVVEAATETAVRVALVSAAHGDPLGRSVVIPVARILDCEVVTGPGYHRDQDTYRLPVFDIDSLWQFQRAFQDQHQHAMNAGWRR